MPCGAVTDQAAFVGGRQHVIAFSDYQSSSMQKQCTTGKKRRVKRWQHEAIVDAMRCDAVRLEHGPGKMEVRRQNIEHPFGTLNIGWAQLSD